MHRVCANVLRVDTYRGVGACTGCLGNTQVVINNRVEIDVDRTRGHLSKSIKLLICPKILCSIFVVFTFRLCKDILFVY